MQMLASKPAATNAEAKSALDNTAAVWAGGALVVGIVAALLIFIHNRYIPITEGWFSGYGRMMRQGKVPYRDFWFFCQPIPLFIAQVINAVSEKLIYVRYYALIERCIITAVLYFVLSRRFSAAASSIATLTSMVCFITYYTDAFFSYLYTCLLFILLASACLQAAYLHPTRRRLFMILSGSCASLAFFTKQSSGLLETAAVGISILVLSPMAWLCVRVPEVHDRV